MRMEASNKNHHDIRLLNGLTNREKKKSGQESHWLPGDSIVAITHRLIHEAEKTTTDTGKWSGESTRLEYSELMLNPMVNKSVIRKW